MADTEVDPREERLIGRLIHSSGRGPQPPPGARERVYATVRAEWQRHIREATPARERQLIGDSWLGSFLRPAFAVSAIAVIAVGMAIFLFLREPAAPSVVQIASVEKLVGTVTSTPAGTESGTGMTEGIMLFAGQRIHTAADGGIALVFASGESVRLDNNTSARLAEAGIELETGAVYVDSEGNPDIASAMIVTSRFGNVRHIGTQYEARVQNAGIRVRIREGTVEIEAESRDLRGLAGEEIVVPVTGAVLRNEIAPTDEAWQWTERLAALPESPGYVLTDLLAWVARQTGRDVRFASARSRLSADQLMLRGLGGLSPQETLDVIASTTTIALTVTADSLIIE